LEEPTESPVLSPDASDTNEKTSPSELSSLVAEQNATLKEVSKELRALNSTAKSGVAAIRAMGQQMCSLLQQQMEERKRQNYFLEKLLETHNK